MGRGSGDHKLEFWGVGSAYHAPQCPAFAGRVGPESGRKRCLSLESLLELQHSQNLNRILYKRKVSGIQGYTAVHVFGVEAPGKQGRIRHVLGIRKKRVALG